MGGRREFAEVISIEAELFFQARRSPEKGNGKERGGSAKSWCRGSSAAAQRSRTGPAEGEEHVLWGEVQEERRRVSMKARWANQKPRFMKAERRKVGKNEAMDSPEGRRAGGLGVGGQQRFQQKEPVLVWKDTPRESLPHRAQWRGSEESEGTREGGREGGRTQGGNLYLLSAGGQILSPWAGDWGSFSGGKESRKQWT